MQKTKIKHPTFFLGFIILTLTFAPRAEAHGQHSEKAHVHGVGQVSIAFDGLKGKLDFESPADSTVGFEHKAQNPAQKKKVAETLEKIKSQMVQMVVFDPTLKCTLQATEAEMDSDDSPHSETHAEFDINCEKSPKGFNMTFHFTRIFPRLKKVQVQILVDDLQKSLIVTQDPTVLTLK